MTNESKVVRYCVDGHSGCLVKERSNHESENRVMYVTHADYRALEERYEALKVTEREGYAEYHRTRVELASIKARVGDDADRWRYLVDRVFYLDGRFRASAVELASIDLRGVPGQSGGDLLTACVDTARKEPK